MEFNSGLVALAAERLHTVLALYQGHGPKGEIADVDAAFAHAVDETLGFYREQLAVTGYPINNVLSVLTKAETFVRWLAVEKKCMFKKYTNDNLLNSEFMTLNMYRLKVDLSLSRNYYRHHEPLIKPL